jgi:hypothetical protein
VRGVAIGCAFFIAAACHTSSPSSDAPAAATAPPAPTAVGAPPKAGTFPVRIDGRSFVDASGRPFEWRGITAFRLAELIASGRERDAVAYLDWAKSEQLTVVRVLLMAQHLFKLSPDAGRAALPRLLPLAKERGIAVEVVALADTKDVTLDYEAHIREIGRIALENGNALIELANEPGHPTQDPRVHAPAFLQHLATLIPEPVIVALGSIEYGDGFAAGDYVTTHTDRGRGEWDHVLALGEVARRMGGLGKPVVSDEPIGAAAEYQAGRRDNDPARFAAAAALTTLSGLGATFHYEGGLNAEIPAGREAACLAAWQIGLAQLGDLKLDGDFVQGEALAKVAQTSGARAAFGRVNAGRAVILLVDPAPAISVKPAPGWKETRRSGVPGVQVVVVERGSP